VRRNTLALIPLLFGAWFFFGLAPYGIHVGEDGDLLYQMFATYRGKLPYVDFSTGYTPLYFYWHAALFWLFGVDALWTRICVAFANTLSLYFLYRIATRLVKPALALLAPLLFVGSLLAYPGDFCTFNAPYPAWYNIVLWLGSIAAVGTHMDRARPSRLALAGLLAGISFSVKPNIGLFNLAALSFFVLWWHAPRPDAGKLARALWQGLALATIAGILGVFWSRLGTREFELFPLPMLVLAGVLLLNGHRAPGRPGFVGATLALVAGFAVPTVPWLIYFLLRLGVHSFLRDVMMVGSSYELFFYIGHRFLWTQWDMGLLAIAVGLAVVPFALQRKLVAPWMPVAGGAAAAVLAGLYIGVFAPMPAGFYLAVTSRVQDLAFFIIHAVNWCALVLIAREVTRHPARRSAFLGTWVLVGLSATGLVLGMYPRSDFMHLLISSPASMIVAVALLGRVLRWWQAALPHGARWRWAAVALVVGPPMLIASVMASRSVGLAANLYSYYLDLRAEPLVRMHLPRASLIMEPDSARRFHDLHDAAQYIDQHSAPEDFVFPFPNLNLLCFLSGRLNPAAKGYFHPGFPDHPTEAEIVSSLRQRAPRMVLGLHGHELFITTSPLYYFLIRDFVRRNYDLAARIGPYDVLTRRDGGVQPVGYPLPVAPAAADDDAWKGLDDPDLQVQLETAKRIGSQRDPAGAAALARRALKPSPYRVLFLRMVQEIGDERAVPALVEIVRRGMNADVGQEAANALFYIAGKSFLEDYWFTTDALEGRLGVLRAQLDVEPFRTWLSDRSTDGRLRYFAIWAAGLLHDQTMAPLLVKTLEAQDLGMSTIATYSLMKMGQVEDTADELVAQLDRDDTYLPSILIDLYVANPDQVRPVIIGGLQGGTPKQRETLSYIAAALHDPALIPPLEELQFDTDPRVQRAATWAVQVLKEPAVVTTGAAKAASAPIRNPG
jgi:HEAT repeat protein